MSNPISDLSAVQIYQQYIKPLSQEQRLKVLELTAHGLANDKSSLAKSPTPMLSLLGLWQGVSISDEDIETARVEMWGAFATEDGK